MKKTVNALRDAKGVGNAMSNDGIQGVAEEVIKQLGPEEIGEAIAEGVKEAVKK